MKKVRNSIKRGALKVKRFLCRPNHGYGAAGQSNRMSSQGRRDTDNMKHVTLIEKVSDIAVTVNSCRKSITSSVLHTRLQNSSIDSARLDPVLPPELIEKIA